MTVFRNEIDASNAYMEAKKQLINGVRYKTIFWEPIEDEALEDIMLKNEGWEIFKMFLVHSDVELSLESYRIVLVKKPNVNALNINSKRL